MPRRYYGRRYRRRRFIPRAPRLKRQVNYMVQRRIERNQETKFNYESIDTSVGVSGSHLSYELSDIDQGLTQSGRTGNQIFVTSFFTRLIFTCVDTTNLIRIILYSPKYSANPITAIEYDDQVDRDQYTVFHDRIFTLAYQQDTHQKVCIIRKKWNRGIKRGILTQYSTAVGTDCYKGQLYLYLVSDSAAANHPKVQGQFYLYFKDG